MSFHFSFDSMTLSYAGQDVIMPIFILVFISSVLLVVADCGTKYAGKEVGRGAICENQASCHSQSESLLSQFLHN